MESKQARKFHHHHQQQRKTQPRAAIKVVATPLQQRSSSDPWSFLELIDAPQWVDLTLEGSSMEKDGVDDPWFDRSHKHHVKSLAGLNANLSWLRLGKLVQGSKSILPIRCQKVPNKPEKKLTAGHQNKTGNKQCQFQGQGTGSRVHKEEQTFYNTVRGCNIHRLFDSRKMGYSLSGCSSTSENESSGSLQRRSLYSDRSSVSSSFQVCSAELKKSSSNAQSGSSDANLSEDFHSVPSSHSSFTQKSRNSSSASYCPPMARYSSEAGVSTCSKLFEFESSGVAKLEVACEPDCQSSGDSVATSESVASSTFEGQAGKGCARAWEEGTDCASKASEPKFNGGFNQLAIGADSNVCHKNLLCCQQMTTGALKSGIKAGRERLVSLVGSLPRKQLYMGKENALPEENLAAGNLLRGKGAPSCTKAPVALAGSKSANVRTVGLSLGGGFHASQASKVEKTRNAFQTRPWKNGSSQSLYSCRASSTAHQRQQSRSNELPVLYEKAGNCERELAALVAQHNQKIRSLQLQNRKKGLR